MAKHWASRKAEPAKVEAAPVADEAELAAVEPEPERAEAPVHAAVVVEAAPAKEPVYHVAKRHAITSHKGIISEGEIVRPKDVSGGIDRLDELAAAGVLVKS